MLKHQKKYADPIRQEISDKADDSDQACHTLLNQAKEKYAAMGIFGGNTMPGFVKQSIEQCFSMVADDTKKANDFYSDALNQVAEVKNLKSTTYEACDSIHENHYRMPTVPYANPHGRMEKTTVKYTNSLLGFYSQCIQEVNKNCSKTKEGVESGGCSPK